MSSRIELVVTRPGHPERRLMLRPGVLRLGRAEDNDLVLADVGVSRRHARIVVNDSGALIEDLGSGNGTIYRGQPVRQHTIKDGDQLQIEPFLLHFKLSPLRTPASNQTNKPARTSTGGVLVVLAGEQLAPRYPVPPGGLTIGRATDQSIVLHDPGSSRRHASLSVRQGGFWLEDNGSANGIFVNGTRVWQHLLQNGDLIKIGHVELRFDREQASKADPFSKIWDESGVWERPPAEDGSPPFAMPPTPPPRVPVVSPTEETQAATSPVTPVQRGRSVQSLSIIAGVIASLLIGGLAVVGWQAVLMMEEQEAARPAPVLLAPSPVLSQEDALAVAQRQIQGRALLEAGRPMEAVLYLYQASKLSPNDPDLARLVARACEAAVLAELTGALQAEQVDEDGRRDRYRSALRAARRPSAEDLPGVRAQLSEALLLFPGDEDLTEALQGIDAALAAIAIEQTEAAASLEGEAARAALVAAVSLSPTSEEAARILAERERSAQPGARARIEQAMRLEIWGLSAEAAVLYAAAAEALPGEHLPLEVIARARMDALGR